MQIALLLIIIATAVFVGFASKKFYDKPQIVNFSIALLMILIVIQTLLMQPITTLGYTAIAFCSIAFIIQLILGIRNSRTGGNVEA